MGWEKRGNNFYYYRKERSGSQVKSTYVGRGEIAHLISQFQSGFAAIEKFARESETANEIESDKAELVFTRAVQLLTQATLLSAGFHTHKRQWRRKRNARH